MCEVINFEAIEKPRRSTEKPEVEHTIISFAEMAEGIEDARILKAKLSLFAKKLIEEGFDDTLVYEEMFKTADSMSCLYSETHGHFIQSVHDELVKFNPELCYNELGMDDIT